jgi:integrase
MSTKRDCDNIPPAIDSTAKGEAMARRRFQRGSVYLKGNVWLGSYSEYVLDSNGVETRQRKEVRLGLMRTLDGEEMSKRDARKSASKLLRPYLDRVNSSLSGVPKTKKITFDAFVPIWEQQYLSLSKPSTQATMRGHAKRLKRFFGSKEMRQIEAADIQCLIAKMVADHYNPKTVRNLWITLRLILNAALIQGYLDTQPPKPKLPRRDKKKARRFLLEEVAKIIKASEGEERCLYWLDAETAIRAGELAGLALSNVSSAAVVVGQAVWNGKVGTPKSPNALRTILVSSQLSKLLVEQIDRQKLKGHDFLFSTATGSPLDINVFRKRRMKPLLESLGIKQAGFHAFRHFANSFLSNKLKVTLKIRQERMGHSSTGSFTDDEYDHTDLPDRIEAAQLMGNAIEQAVNSCCLSAVQQKGLPAGEPEAQAA